VAVMESTSDGCCNHTHGHVIRLMGESYQLSSAKWDASNTQERLRQARVNASFARVLVEAVAPYLVVHLSVVLSPLYQSPLISS
jgi:hypothetical protein